MIDTASLDVRKGYPLLYRAIRRNAFATNPRSPASTESDLDMKPRKGAQDCWQERARTRRATGREYLASGIAQRSFHSPVSG